MRNSRLFSITPAILLIAAHFAGIFCSFADDPTAPDRWEKDMVAFEARDAKSPAPEGCLLFVGSSSIRMWDLESSWPKQPAINNGFGGSTLADSIRHFDRLIAPYKPGAVILYAGDNDMNKGMTPEEVETDFTTLAGLITKALPEVPVIFIAIKPSLSRWDLWPAMKTANDLIAARCADQKNLFFADISTVMLGEQGEPPSSAWFKQDGLHLSPYGYSRWTEVVNAQIKAAGVAGTPGE